MVFKACEQPDDGAYTKIDIYASQLIKGKSKIKCFDLKDNILYIFCPLKQKNIICTCGQ